MPDDVMYYIRVTAVHTVRVLGQSPETLARAYNFNRDGIDRWLRRYNEGGYGALGSQAPPGAKPVADGNTDTWMRNRGGA